MHLMYLRSYFFNIVIVIVIGCVTGLLPVIITEFLGKLSGDSHQPLANARR